MFKFVHDIGGTLIGLTLVVVGEMSSVHLVFTVDVNALATNSHILKLVL